MSMNYTHSCIKCQASYEDTDPEPYFCETCNEERKRIAKEIDKQMANRPPKREKVSLVQAYENAPKIRGFMSANDLMRL